MNRVEGIKAVLQRLAGEAPLPVVQGDGEHGQHRQQLPPPRRAQPAEHTQPQQLDDQLALGLPGHIEQQHQQHAPAAVVRVQPLGQQESHGDGGLRRKPLPQRSAGAGPLHGPAHQRAQQQRPQHVLVVHGEPYAVHQVERRLRQHGKPQKPCRVPLFIVGVGAALRDEEAEDGECQPSHAPHPQGVGEQCGAHVVDEHGGHGQQLQVQTIERQRFFVHVVPPAPTAPHSR